MRNTVSLLVVLGAAIAPISMARAQTVVAHFPANNRFATVNSTAPDGTSIQIGVTRELGGSGGPLDQIGIIIFPPDGNVTFARGTLPAGAFHFDAQGASVNVDVADIAFEIIIGDLPESGVIDIDWEATDTTRTAGNNVSDQGNLRIIFAGVRTEVVADVAGTLFGVPLADPNGSLQSLSQQVTVITTP
jgi:hypothetical protein